MSEELINMGIPITYIRIRTGTGEIVGGTKRNVIDRHAFSALTPDILRNIKCLPGNIQDKLKIINPLVRMPKAPLQFALRKIDLDTPVTCSDFTKKYAPKRFEEAIAFFKECLKTSDAKIGAALGVEADPYGRTWPGAHLQLNFHTWIKGSMDLSKDVIHIDLYNMYSLA